MNTIVPEPMVGERPLSVRQSGHEFNLAHRLARVRLFGCYFR
jgi:hypothetical protein